MEFGHLTPEVLDSIDFTLPEDSSFTKKIFSTGTKDIPPLIYVGCAKWGRKEWVGNLYPAKTKEADFLNNYVKHFNSIELNATHYKIYAPADIKKWAEKADGRNFKFCPKVPQTISHFGNLTGPNVQSSTDDFLNGILAFKDHLGPIFLQLSDKFSPARKDNLYAYLKSLPKDLQFFAEVRHANWFDDKIIASEFLETLRISGVGAVITDTAGRRDCVHMELTIPKAFIRFVGNDLHPTDYTRVDQWVKRIKKWLAAGLKELYFFMHQPDEKYSPQLCDYLVEQLNKQCKLQLIRPLEPNPPNPLF